MLFGGAKEEVGFPQEEARGEQVDQYVLTMAKNGVMGVLARIYPSGHKRAGQSGQLEGSWTIDSTERMLEHRWPGHVIVRQDLSDRRRKRIGWIVYKPFTPSEVVSLSIVDHVIVSIFGSVL